MSTLNFEDMNEEFNNFMYKVNEVQGIVKKMSSQNKDLQDIGSLEADKYLQNKAEILLENVDEKDIVVKVTSNRTVINKKALMKIDNENANTMSQDAFMDEVSKDADKRYKDRLVRTEKMETFKKQATLAFRRNEFDRALCCYNKAIDQIRDSPLLYNNRCLTYIKLNFYDKAICDGKTALELNENCLRTYLLLAKAYYMNDNMMEYENSIKEAMEKHRDEKEFINGYVADILKDAIKK